MPRLLSDFQTDHRGNPSFHDAGLAPGEARPTILRTFADEPLVLQTSSSLQLIGEVGLFPAEFAATEVTTGSRLAIDRATEVEVLDDAAWGQREDLANEVANLAVGNLAGAEGINVNADRFANADGVGELYFALLGEASSDDVLGNVASHVSSAAIDLGWVLAAESATAVTAPTAVGIDDDLTTGQAAVTVRTANDELAGGVDVVLDLALDEVLWQFWLDDLFDHVVLDLFLRDRRTVLRRDNHRVDANRLLAIVFDGDLALAIGTKPVDFTLLASFRQAIEDAVRQSNREWHELWGFVGGKTEHQTLVASADIFASVSVVIHAHGDVRALAVQTNFDGAGCCIEADVVVGVADFLDDLTGNLLEIDVGLGGDFTSEAAEVGGYQGFASDAAVRILSEDRIQNAVGNLIRQLVRMPHADRFTREQKLSG